MLQNNLTILSSRFKATMSTLPYKVGVIMVAFSKDRFKYGNWIDNSTEKWQPRIRKKQWTKKGKAPNNTGRAVLVQSGRLRRSIRIVSTNTDSVTIGSDVPYAQAHNQGLRIETTQRVRAFVRMNKRKDVFETTGKRKKKIASGVSHVKAHDRTMSYKMPRRQFMGNSKYLNMQITRLITAEINKIFN
jgi:phage gpG-like protein